MARLDIERQKRLEPQRMDYATKEIEKLGYQVTKISDQELQVTYKEQIVRVYPYSGWHTGKTVIAQRGLQELLNQLRTK